MAKYSKKCPICDTEQTYTTNADLLKALRKDTKCKSCAVRDINLEAKELPFISVDFSLPIAICFNCSREFNPSKYKLEAKYCSAFCRQKHSWRLGIKKRADSQRDKGEGKSYRKRNGRHEHRLIMEQLLGRSLLPDEVVHHKDTDVRNNDPTNLEIMTRSAHSRMHATDYHERKSDAKDSLP